MIENKMNTNETKRDAERKYYENIALNMPIQERLNIINALLNKSCLSCTNACCRVESSEKVGYDENENPMGYQCIGWSNEEIIGKSRALNIFDIRNLK